MVTYYIQSPQTTLKFSPYAHYPSDFVQPDFKPDGTIQPDFEPDGFIQPTFPLFYRRAKDQTGILPLATGTS